jgi:hypothetical protein
MKDIKLNFFQEKQNTIPLFEGRPQRQTIITNDDLLNLKIILETSESYEKLLSTI